MIPVLALALVLPCVARAQAAPRPAVPPEAAPRYASLGLPAILTKDRLQGLLQGFVDGEYGRAFRHLGDERDFDHGHLLLDARTGRPVAILYHTQELADEAAAADFGYIDPEARNWIQWLDGRGVENARRYERETYPRSPEWDWFVSYDLPRLRRRHTITDRMLDPRLLGLEFAPGLQWTFTQVPCGSESDAFSNVIGIRLPGRAAVCLSLGSS